MVLHLQTQKMGVSPSQFLVLACRKAQATLRRHWCSSAPTSFYSFRWSIVSYTDLLWCVSFYLRSLHSNMESNAALRDNEDQDEYVLLDLNGVADQIDFPPNAKYVLTGLDTLNPVLIIDDKFKLIGEYEETIGTCLAFTEHDAPVVHEETGPSEVNLFSGTRLIDSSQPTTKQVKPVCQLHKVLKFKLVPDSEIRSVTTEEAK